jgi:hypothetical protein
MKALYAPDAVAETPGQGTINGRDQIAAYLAEFGTRARIDVLRRPEGAGELYGRNRSRRAFLSASTRSWRFGVDPVPSTI